MVRIPLATGLVVGAAAISLHPLHFHNAAHKQENEQQHQHEQQHEQQQFLAGNSTSSSSVHKDTRVSATPVRQSASSSVASSTSTAVVKSSRVKHLENPLKLTPEQKEQCLKTRNPVLPDQHKYIVELKNFQNVQ